MKETDGPKAMDGSGETRSPLSDLEQGQIICVIGKSSFSTSRSLFYTAYAGLAGGPGVGKGTQCTKLANDLGAAHLSVGDLLRREASKVLENHGIDIVAHMRDGKLVPKEIVQCVLEDDLVLNIKAGKTRILLDGFPRSMDQMNLFEASVSAETPIGCNMSHQNSADRYAGLQDQSSVVVSRVQRDTICSHAQPIKNLWSGWWVIFSSPSFPFLSCLGGRRPLPPPGTRLLTLGSS